MGEDKKWLIIFLLNLNIVLITFGLKNEPRCNKVPKFIFLRTLAKRKHYWGQNMQCKHIKYVM